MSRKIALSIVTLLAVSCLVLSLVAILGAATLF
jgi:hypothetical protein